MSSFSSTQDHLPIAGIQDGVVIMVDGSLRSVIHVEPVNFELKSGEEQDAIIYSYQSFLNSLEFPIQILMQSKRLDLEQYLIRLDQSRTLINNDLLQVQINDYIGFVRRLISVANIMSKRFYVVVSYLGTSVSTGFTQLSALIPHQPSGPLLGEEDFARFRGETLNRANLIANGLSRLGCKCSFLDTQDLIELFYTIYNPDVAAEERLAAVSDISSGVVSAPTVEAGDTEAPPAPTDTPPTSEFSPTSTSTS